MGVGDVDCVGAIRADFGAASGRAARQGAADDKARTGDAPTPASTLLFESLEPRLLLAADPLGITAGYAFNETSGTTTVDASGHGITGTLTNGPTFAAGSMATPWPWTGSTTSSNLTFDAIPTGVTLYLDGIAHAAPFVYDTLVGFNHTIEARNAVVGSNTYTFASWSDGGAQTHAITVPETAQTYSATYTVTNTPAPLAFVQVAAVTPQTNQTTVAMTYASAQVAGDTNILAIGWNNTTSNITSVTDFGRQRLSAGRADRARLRHQPGHLLRQQHQGGSRRYQHRDGDLQRRDRVCRHPRDGVQRSRSGQPVRRGASASGSSASASTAAVTTTAPRELIFGAGITTGLFTGAGTSFTSRIITSPDGDIVEDRFVTATGSYSATATLGSAAWLMQIATFRAASQT